MKYEISRDSSLFENYLEVMKNRIYKILPLIEEENEGVYQYVDSTIFELYGLQYVITGVRDSFNYISLLTTLESLLDEIIVQNRDLKFIRSEIFKAISIVEKIQKGE